MKRKITASDIVAEIEGGHFPQDRRKAMGGSRAYKEDSWESIQTWGDKRVEVGGGLSANCRACPLQYQWEREKKGGVWSDEF